mgnify:CR=1 FL=1
MLFGLISDSHGEGAAVLAVGNIFQQRQVKRILHLGDDYQDILFLQDLGIAVLAVPGLYCPEYRDPTIPNRRRERLAGLTVLMTHSPKISPYDLPGDGDPQDLARTVDLVLYGHTHIPRVHRQDGIWWINPGHLKAADNRGWPPSYGLLEITPPTVAVSLLTLATGETLTEHSWTLPPPQGRS